MVAPKHDIRASIKDQIKVAEHLEHSKGLTVEQARDHVKTQLGIEMSDSAILAIGAAAEYKFASAPQLDVLNDLAVLAHAVLHIFAQSGIELTPSRRAALEKISTPLDVPEPPKETNK